ncbi:DUF3600 domain-containing protein [Paenibacillus turpanensis]|uniref:DUF3600 domain-containing protein n=1 Tax=Paenibacillus turpanensis TaxID=2689078 RepID=UPI00140DBE50|nr:DUF3600 domain-containing protein [Paenibacillus turpanensis]
MELERQIEGSLRKRAASLQAPERLDSMVMEKLTRSQARPQRTKGRVFPRLAASIALVAVILTASAFANPSLADRIYGSFEQLKQQVITVTLQEYQRFGMKLGGAQKALGADYPAFEKLMREVGAAKVAYGKQGYSSIDFAALAPEKRQELKQLYADIQPYFDRLNGDPVLKERLTPQEYEEYIEATLIRETVYAQTGVTPGAEAEEVPEAQRAEYAKALETIRMYEEKSRAQ